MAVPGRSLPWIGPTSQTPLPPATIDGFLFAAFPLPQPPHAVVTPVGQAPPRSPPHDRGRRGPLRVAGRPLGPRGPFRSCGRGIDGRALAFDRGPRRHQRRRPLARLTGVGRAPLPPRRGEGRGDGAGAGRPIPLFRECGPRSQGARRPPLRDRGPDQRGPGSGGPSAAIVRVEPYPLAAAPLPRTVEWSYRISPHGIEPLPGARLASDASASA